jgi:hypothetical protein
MPDITGLFCEYGFCIGHSTSVYLKDPKSLDEIDEWSDYRSGVLVGVGDSSMMFVKWLISSKAEWDAPRKAEDILRADHQPTGNVNEEMIGDLKVAYLEGKNKTPKLRTLMVCQQHGSVEIAVLCSSFARSGKGAPLRC